MATQSGGSFDSHRVVSHKEWLAARTDFLVRSQLGVGRRSIACLARVAGVVIIVSGAIAIARALRAA